MIKLSLPNVNHHTKWPEKVKKKNEQNMFCKYKHKQSSYWLLLTLGY